MAATVGVLLQLLLKKWSKSAEQELEEEVTRLSPKIVIILSGKRKSGKDYTAEKLFSECVLF